MQHKQEVNLYSFKQVSFRYYLLPWHKSSPSDWCNSLSRLFQSLIEKKLTIQTMAEYKMCPHRACETQIQLCLFKWQSNITFASRFKLLNKSIMPVTMHMLRRRGRICHKPPVLTRWYCSEQTKEHTIHSEERKRSTCSEMDKTSPCPYGRNLRLHRNYLTVESSIRGGLTRGLSMNGAAPLDKSRINVS
jgi:hypothetical protein